MHFEWYLTTRFFLQLYGRYFWYLELSRATQVIAAYAGEELQGFCLQNWKESLKNTVPLEDHLCEAVRICAEYLYQDSAEPMRRLPSSFFPPIWLPTGPTE